MHGKNLLHIYNRCSYAIKNNRNASNVPRGARELVLYGTRVLVAAIPRIEPRH